MSIDTATDICSVAILERSTVLFDRESGKERNHAALIGGYARQALDYVRENGLQLAAVAISQGPGSYTGLRIGASFAKGLCFALGIPLLPVSGLKALADGYCEDVLSLEKRDKTYPTLICPMIDARRMEVYRALYTLEGEEVLSPAVEEIKPESFADYCGGNYRIYFVGNGAEKCQPVLQCVYAEYDDFDSRARYFRQQAFTLYDRKAFADLAYWTPDYFKPYTAVKSKNKVLSQVVKE